MGGHYNMTTDYTEAIFNSPEELAAILADRNLTKGDDLHMYIMWAVPQPSELARSSPEFRKAAHNV
jgi:hypothetical protein